MLKLWKANIPYSGGYTIERICDECGELITREQQGNIQWRAEDENNKRLEMFLTHKHCCAPFENKRGGRSAWRWRDLNYLEVSATPLGYTVSNKEE